MREDASFGFQKGTNPDEEVALHVLKRICISSFTLKRTLRFT